MCQNRKSAAQRSLAAWTRESLLALGPTFIKLGQLFSTRSDLLPAEFTEVALLLKRCSPPYCTYACSILGVCAQAAAWAEHVYQSSVACSQGSLRMAEPSVVWQHA